MTTMRVTQHRWTAAKEWETVHQAPDMADAQLLLVFGGRGALASADVLAPMRAAYPSAEIVGCSTAGEIAGTEVLDDSIVATALRFAHTQVRVVVESLPKASDSDRVGESLARALPHEGLAHVLVLSEGIHVNGSELLAGLRRGLPSTVVVTGGLAGDGARFEHTCLCHNTDRLERHVAVIGFYGDRLRIGHGSMGGWDPFGPIRVITRSEGNVLYELDGQSALALYKSYLGPHAAELPASGLRFPLALRSDDDGQPGLVRTILSIDEAAGSLTFAGDMPQGTHAQLMKANVDRLIDGAQGAVSACMDALGATAPAVGILISCVGRKLVMSQRVEEEVEAVRDVLGAGVPLCGFYSYGEVAPFNASMRCELHNQTMTITTFDER